MNSISTVVIGANYGDEGKGLITDFEVRRTGAATVARFNGGAQAGHTVYDGDRRHVFGHVGAGTFAGAGTYLASKFIVNTMVLEREMKALHPFNPIMSAHPDARVSTVYDMMLNALAEVSRGNKRHGSCGLGINETVTRHEQYPLTVKFLTTASFPEIALRLYDIRNSWVPKRMKALGITDVPEPYKSALELDASGVANSLLGPVARLYATQRPKPEDGIVFEGAQGLMLDEFLGKFPHVTRSMTGLPYAIIAAAELGVKRLRATYVTRSYLTRHGAGPLEHEGHDFGGYEIDGIFLDKTNVENPWQGTLRHAPLNLPMLAHFIHEDTVRAEYVAQAHGVELVQPTLALTCLDQLHGDMTIVDLDGQFKTLRTSYLPTYLSRRLNLHVSHISHGPNSTDVEYLSPV
jgi:adenylosuccinate synthase